MEFWKDFFSIVQSALTSIGIIVGGIWTYFLFVRQRLSFPKINIDIFINDMILPEGARFIHTEIKLNNIGHVILKSDYAELRLRQIVPIHEKINADIERGFDPVLENKTEIEWPLIAGREWKWNEREFEIEPGESDSLHADYIIDSNVKVAEFYYYISNAKKKHQGIGWTLTRIHQFDKKEDSWMSNVKKQKGNDSRKTLTKQQKPQKPQQPKQPRKKK